MQLQVADWVISRPTSGHGRLRHSNYANLFYGTYPPPVAIAGTTLPTRALRQQPRTLAEAPLRSRTNTYQI